MNINLHNIIQNYIIFQKDYISLIVGGSKDISDSIKRILPRILSKAVQLKYSGCGRQNHNKKKDSFAETNTYKIMKGMHFIMINFIRF